MTDRNGCVDESDADGPHRRAAESFVRRIRTRDVAGVEKLVLFGSAARGDADGLESDVDFLVVVSDDVDSHAVREELRDVAYAVMLECGPVVQTHVLSRSEFEEDRRTGHPFVQNVLREGRTYA